MKTILSLLLLPIMVLAQPHGQHQIESFDIEFSMDFAMEPILNEETDSPEPVDGTIELFITIEVYVWEMEIDYAIPQFTHDAAIVSYLPKYLNTFSLVGLANTVKENQRPQERLNRLLALNDPMFPKEDTLLDGLNPVRYQQNTLGDLHNMPEGFGPQIGF
ncbi:hypothetical protein [Spongiimicrobium sp. 3-5]|uniref:hypothetical protein n=1 Tax=Spongiimicrobium sp. 3-5 TaxID=3332596 RepID=UPI00397E9474